MLADNIQPGILDNLLFRVTSIVRGAVRGGLEINCCRTFSFSERWIFFFLAAILAVSIPLLLKPGTDAFNEQKNDIGNLWP